MYIIIYVQENDEGDSAKILYKDAAYYGAFVQSAEFCAARYKYTRSLETWKTTLKLLIDILE